MTVHSRRLLSLAALVGLLSFTGCGDPCLDDGAGKGGKCTNPPPNTTETSATASGTGSETASGTATETAEAGTAEAGDGCMNGMADPDETDVDCGGVCVDPNTGEGACDNGQLCELGVDCISGFCDNGTCAPEPEGCANMTMDPGETDVDCGGDCVVDPGDPQNPDGKCGEGLLCEIDSDCVSNFCDMGTCAPPVDPCTDMTMGGDETDVDCGGSCVENPNDPNNDNGKCDPGDTCLIDSDCASELCEAGVCAEPDPCSDAMMTNDETDIDCGGSCVTDPNDPMNDEGKCGDGQGCLINGDCINEMCSNGVCAGPCADGMQNNDETDVDCGGMCVLDPNDPQNDAGKCDPGEACLIDSDCTTNTCQGGVCVDLCINMMQDPGETDDDCGGVCVEDPNDPMNPDGKCISGQLCLVDSDCQSHSCNVNGLCDPGPCENLMMDMGETDVDCGDQCVVDPNDPMNPAGKCFNGQTCALDSDCISNMCNAGICEDGGMCMMDNMQNGNETDVDCGGDCVNAQMGNNFNVNGQCGEGEGCLIDQDCVAGNCENDTCNTCSTENSNSCQACLQTKCCDNLLASCWDNPQCVCWFNCIQHNNDFQPCFDACGSGGFGAVTSCANSQCNNLGECALP
jgi:hypothetical protein